MSRPLLALCGVGILCAAAAAQGTFPLERKAAEMSQMPALRMGIRFCGRQAGPTQGLKGVPPDAAKANMFFALRVSGGIRWAVSLPGEAPALLVDTDNDKDFSDEKPLTGNAEGSSIDFGTVDIALGNRGTVTVRLIGNAQKPGDAPRYMLTVPGAYRTGTVKLAGKSYALALLDNSMNGRYDDAFDVSVGQNGTDGLGLDLNANGTFDPPRGLAGPFEVMLLGKRLRIQDAFYSVAVAADGSSITLKRIEPGYGTLDFGRQAKQFMAYSDYGVTVGSTGADGTARLPAGKYSFLRIAMTKTDESGEAWQLTMSDPPEALKAVDIRKGGTTRVAIGPPLAAKVDIRQRGRQAYLGLLLKGRAGEQYVPGVTKAQRRLPPPQFTVLGEDGQEVYSGTFEYG